MINLFGLTTAMTVMLLGSIHFAGAAQFDVAVLQGLDKVTARVSKFNAPVGATIRFGTLEIIVRKCDKRPPEEAPESAAFIEVWEVRPDELIMSVYRGWMFASSPALAAMEHAVYDVWILDCKNSQLGISKK